jgi:chromatin remodeling complex protein RSC6
MNLIDPKAYIKSIQELMQNEENEKNSKNPEIDDNTEKIDTKFGIFNEFTEDSGFLSIKNSFGEIQWVCNNGNEKQGENHGNENNGENQGFENNENEAVDFNGDGAN